MNEKFSNTLALYRKLNAGGRLNLARQAAVAGVKRFIFISSIKANGESTIPAQTLTPNEHHILVDLYGLLKYEAEWDLKLIADQAGLEVVVIRPPLIYRLGVKTNFSKMMQWVEK